MKNELVEFFPENTRKLAIKNNENIKQFEFAMNKERGVFEMFIRCQDDKRKGLAIPYDKKIFKDTARVMVDSEHLKLLTESINNCSI